MAAGRSACPHAGIDAANPIVIDMDAMLVTPHSDKEGAAATFKRGDGHHPLRAFLGHGPPVGERSRLGLSNMDPCCIVRAGAE